MASQPGVNASSQSSHRLPTVSASQALRNLKSNVPKAVPTGLKRLDALLGTRLLHPYNSSASQTAGGYAKGRVTEIYGPPGVGKTTFCMQASAGALHGGDHVVWVDASAPIAWPRLDQIFSAISSAQPQKNESREHLALLRSQAYSRFHHFTTPTLAHLIALVMHPKDGFPPPKTSVMVIDSMSTLFDMAYPRHGMQSNSGLKNDIIRWASGRRSAVMNELISRLNLLAALNNIAVLLTNQTATKVRTESGALLMPSLSGTEWDGGVATRLVLFRDWPPAEARVSEEDKRRLIGLRFAGLTKVDGNSLAEDGSGVSVVPFTIDSAGLREIELLDTSLDHLLTSSPVRCAKRSFSEIADSDAEDGDLGSDAEYGWVEDDEVAAEGLVDDDVIENLERSYHRGGSSQRD